MLVREAFERKALFATPAAVRAQCARTILHKAVGQLLTSVVRYKNKLSRGAAGVFDGTQAIVLTATALDQLKKVAHYESDEVLAAAVECVAGVQKILGKALCGDKGLKLGWLRFMTKSLSTSRAHVRDFNGGLVVGFAFFVVFAAVLCVVDAL